ncbi:MAG: UDP-3-O-acyl-N-acetylglucosamine deacetylase [Planctomycetota bacterium]
MHPSRNQHTIAESCQVSGRGYWSGQAVCVQLHPAAACTGITLVRSDLVDQPSCPATSDFAIDADFRTNLVCGPARFQMVEHLMAALAGLEIDNCLVEIDGEELPGLDGSCLPYVQALQNAGLVIQAAARPRFVVKETIRVSRNDTWIEATPSTDGYAHFAYDLNYGQRSPIRPQSFAARMTPRSFATRIAPARTFVTAEQAQQLRAAGVAAHVTNQDLLVFDDHGPVDNPLHFDNECARHKTLDLIGDLAMAGIDFVGQVRSHRGGHILNGQMARKLRRAYDTQLEGQDPFRNSRNRNAA